MTSRISLSEPRPIRRPETERWLWVFDFDGTLSPIVPDRHSAMMDRSCRRLLMDLMQAGQQVAILSSRRLDDLYPRIDLPGVYAGGGMGLEWILPSGERRSYAEAFEEDVIHRRTAMSGQLDYIEHVLDADVEDKFWTVSVHVRHLEQDRKEEVKRELDAAARLYGLKIRNAPEAFEVLFSPSLDKSFGVSVLCRIAKWEASRGRLVYAGDDENDSVAMELVAHLGGVTISVARFPTVRESIVVRDPPHLAAVCRSIAGL